MAVGCILVVFTNLYLELQKSIFFGEITQIVLGSSPVTGLEWRREGFRKLSFPDFVTTAQVGGKVASPTQRPLQKRHILHVFLNLLVLLFVLLLLLLLTITLM